MSVKSADFLFRGSRNFSVATGGFTPTFNSVILSPCSVVINLAIIKVVSFIANNDGAKLTGDTIAVGVDALNLHRFISYCLMLGLLACKTHNLFVVWPKPEILEIPGAGKGKVYLVSDATSYICNPPPP